MFRRIKSRYANGDGSLLLLGETTMEDYDIMKQVLAMKTCTYSQYHAILNGLQPTEDSISTDQQTVSAKYKVSLSQNARHMQESIAEAASQQYQMDEEEKDQVRKEVMAQVSKLFNDSRVSRDDIRNWRDKMIQSTSDVIVSASERFGTQGGDLEFACVPLPNNAPRQKRKKGVLG